MLSLPRYTLETELSLLALGSQGSQPQPLTDLLTPCPSGIVSSAVTIMHLLPPPASFCSFIRPFQMSATHCTVLSSLSFLGALLGYPDKKACLLNIGCGAAVLLKRSRANNVQGAQPLWFLGWRWDGEEDVCLEEARALWAEIENGLEEAMSPCHECQDCKTDLWCYGSSDVMHVDDKMITFKNNNTKLFLICVLGTPYIISS